MREGIGVVVYLRSAFPAELAGSAFVPVDPPVLLPFAPASRDGAGGGALESMPAVAASLRR